MISDRAFWSVLEELNSAVEILDKAIEESAKDKSNDADQNLIENEVTSDDVSISSNDVKNDDSGIQQSNIKTNDNESNGNEKTFSQSVELVLPKKNKSHKEWLAVVLIALLVVGFFWHLVSVK